MPRKHFYLILLYFLLAFLIVPVAHAQSTADLDFNDVIRELGPRSGDELLWDIMLYFIFFLGLINTFLIPDKQIFPSMLNFLVMGLAIVSKLLVGDGRTIQPTDFAVLILNVGMFVIPLIMAGMLRTYGRKGRAPRALIPCIMMGLTGGAYFFLFWALEQRGT